LTLLQNRRSARTSSSGIIFLKLQTIAQAIRYPFSQYSIAGSLLTYLIGWDSLGLKATVHSVWAYFKELGQFGASERILDSLSPSITSVLYACQYVRKGVCYNCKTWNWYEDWKMVFPDCKIHCRHARQDVHIRPRTCSCAGFFS